MAKIHDWNRVYWNNAQDTREYDPTGIDPAPEVMCIYENDHGDQVSYQLTERNERQTFTFDVPETDQDEDQDEDRANVGEELDEALNEIEDERGLEIDDATEVDRDESDDEVSVTVDITWDIPKYEVRFNGDLITDVEFPEGSRWFKDDPDEDEEQRPAHVEEARFPTRAMAREFTAAWREEFGNPEQLGYVDYSFEEVMDMDYQDEVVPLAKDYGVFDADGVGRDHESLAEAISGEEAPEEEEAEAAEAE